MRLSAVRLSDESAPRNRAGMRLEDAFRWACGLRIRGRCAEARPGGGVPCEGELVGEADQLLGLQFGERRRSWTLAPDGCSRRRGARSGPGTRRHPSCVPCGGRAPAAPPVWWPVTARVLPSGWARRRVRTVKPACRGAFTRGGRGRGCTDAPPGRTRWGVSHAEHRPANRLSAKGRS
jgi:hypothetical protein